MPSGIRQSKPTIGAGEGNRTLVISLEGFCSTIELHPRRLRKIAYPARPARAEQNDYLTEDSDYFVSRAAATACWNKVCIAAVMSPSVVTVKNIPGDAQLCRFGPI
jgi:hypothetical protein